MANTISAIAYAIRTATVTSATPVKMGHSNQLVAAAFGHKSFASYQAANEDDALDAATHIVLDANLLEQRAKELGILLEKQQLVTLVGAAIRGNIGSEQHFHDDADDFQAALEADLETAVSEDDQVSGEMASSNNDGIGWVSLPIDLSELMASGLSGEVCVAHVQGTVTLNVDTERPYSGHEIGVSVDVEIDRLGSRCFGDPYFDVTGAVLRGYDDDRDEPSISLAQALADFTGLDISTAEAMADVAPIQEASEDGLAYNYIFDFSKQLQPEAEAEVRSIYPNLKVVVPAWIIDQVSSSSH